MTDVLILSNGLDTNGQNARYKAAAEKYGTDYAVIEALAIGKIDPGGVVARLQEASTKYAVGLHIRSAHKHEQYFAFANDLRWGHDAPSRDNHEVRLLAKHADVIHLNNSEVGAVQLGLMRKPMLLHHHGSLFRSNPQRMLDMARMRKMVQAVSTVDLQKPDPAKLHWLPTAYDIDGLGQWTRQRRERDTVRVVHCPTNRELKRTDLIIAAVDQLRAEGAPVELIIVEHVTNAEAMAIKATADIVYDQIMFGYGCNAVEAWGMGIPVISGADEWTTKRMRELWGGLPYEHATATTLKKVLKRLVLSADARAEAAARGMAHARKYHDERPALTILAELYHDAIAAKTRTRIEGKGVTFASKRHKVMTVDGIRVDFTKGTATVTDQDVVQRLRLKAKTRPMFGIEEVA